GLVTALNNLGAVLVRMGRLRQAEQILDKCCTLEEQLEDSAGLATTWHNLGRLAEIQGMPDRARHGYRRSLELFQALGWSADVEREAAALQRLDPRRAGPVPEGDGAPEGR
ncbi:MAG: tetratricopeptide repeat protein, partial [Chloroflexia bacterium]